MKTDNDHDVTQDSLIACNAYFKKILDLVPPKAYFDADSNQKISAHRIHSQHVSDNSKEAEFKDLNARLDKQRIRRLKFDPTQPTKNSELQQILPSLAHDEGEGRSLFDLHQNDNGDVNNRIFNGEVKDKSSINDKSSNILSRKMKPSSTSKPETTAKNPTEKVKLTSNQTDMANAAVSERDNITSQKQDRKNTNKNDMITANASSETSSGNSAIPSPGSVSVKPKLNADQLREKLRARIVELQAKRQRGMTPEEFLESKKLRRKESKLKLKQKRKEAKKLKLSVEKQSKNSQNKSNGVSEVKSEADVKSTNNSNKMVFSKFEFSEQAKKPKDRKQKKPKSFRELYEKVTKDNEKLEELKHTDAEKAKKIAEKAAWRKAMEQSKGVKVKDNPELIKKSMKKEEKLKDRSHKKWQERTATVADQQQKRQDKRKKNILAKKQTKLDRKVKLAKKKGRLVSGF